MSKPIKPFATPPVPTPKYSIGETIICDRNNDGREVATIEAIELRLSGPGETFWATNPPGVWQVVYWSGDIDDEVPEATILGPVAVGAKR